MLCNVIELWSSTAEVINNRSRSEVGAGV